MVFQQFNIHMLHISPCMAIHPCIPIARLPAPAPQGTPAASSISSQHTKAISTRLFFQRLNTWSWWPQPSYAQLEKSVNSSILCCESGVGEFSETSMHCRIPLNLAPKRWVSILCLFSFRAEKHGVF